MANWVTFGTTQRTRSRPGESVIRCRQCGKTAMVMAGTDTCPTCLRHIAEARRAIDRRNELSKVWCRHCGAHFIPQGQRKVFCTDKCSYSHRAEEALSLARAAAEQLDLGTATGWLHRLYRYLADRDGSRCSLCNRKVRLDLTGRQSDMRGPSVDHVIPRSKGGSDDLSNLALAHLICNVRKGNRAANDQLRLFG